MTQYRKPFLCRLGLHRYEEVGVFGLLHLIDQCKRCGWGRDFMALVATYRSIPPEQMAELRKRVDDDAG